MNVLFGSRNSITRKCDTIELPQWCVLTARVSFVAAADGSFIFSTYTRAAPSLVSSSRSLPLAPVPNPSGSSIRLIAVVRMRRSLKGRLGKSSTLKRPWPTEHQNCRRPTLRHAGRLRPPATATNLLQVMIIPRGNAKSTSPISTVAVRGPTRRRRLSPSLRSPTRHRHRKRKRPR